MKIVSIFIGKNEAVKNPNCLHIEELIAGDKGWEEIPFKFKNVKKNVDRYVHHWHPIFLLRVILT